MKIKNKITNLRIKFTKFLQLVFFYVFFKQKYKRIKVNKENLIIIDSQDSVGDTWSLIHFIRNVEQEQSNNEYVISLKHKKSFQKILSKDIFDKIIFKKHTCGSHYCYKKQINCWYELLKLRKLTKNKKYNNVFVCSQWLTIDSLAFLSKCNYNNFYKFLRKDGFSLPYIIPNEFIFFSNLICSHQIKNIQDLDWNNDDILPKIAFDLYNKIEKTQKNLNFSFANADDDWKFSIKKNKIVGGGQILTSKFCWM